MELKIRTATPADLDAVTAVERNTFPPEEACTREVFAYRLETFPERFLVAELEGKPVGIVNGCTTDEPLICDRLFEAEGHDPKGANQMIFGLAVLPEYQCRGIAARLMEAIIQLAKQEGRRSMVLTCKARLIPYYEKFGYENRGVSASVHGGAIWYDMVLPL